jgi:hypothetical protein
MAEFFSRLFDPSGFQARWMCVGPNPYPGWLHIVSDFAIFVAYVAIPGALYVFVRNRRDLVFPAIFWLFIAFILSCGITHAADTMMFWWPAYRFTGVLKAITAVVSLATVVALIRIMPTALSIPSLTREHKQMRQELGTVRREHDVLSTARNELERRSAEMVVRDRRVRDALLSAKVCAFAWDLDSGKFTWETGFRQLMRTIDVDGMAGDLRWELLVGEAGAADLKARAEQACKVGETMYVRMALQGHEGRWDIRINMTPEPAATGYPRTMVGVFGILEYGISRAGDAGPMAPK